jgi:hypothetical protein
MTYGLALLNLVDCANLDQRICIHDFRSHGLELLENWQSFRIKRMESRATLRCFGYNASHCESLYGDRH